MTILVILVSIGFAIVFSIYSNYKAGLALGLVIFVIFSSQLTRRTKYFITNILLIDNKKVEIKYFDRKNIKTLLGQIQEFEFKKQYTFSKNNSYYLGIYFNNELMIEQFDIGEWNEAKIDSVIKSINSIKESIV